jgi:hypothetical protein
MELPSKSDTVYSKFVLRCTIGYIIWVFGAITVLIKSGPFEKYVSTTKTYFTQAILSHNITTASDNLIIVIKTPSIWWLIMFVVMANQLATSISKNIVNLWITNELKNDKISRMRFGYKKTLLLVSLYRMASWIDYLIFLFILLQRPDFMFLSLIATIGCEFFTLRIHLNHKLYTINNRMNMSRYQSIT